MMHGHYWLLLHFQFALPTNEDAALPYGLEAAAGHTHSLLKNTVHIV